MSVEKCSSDFTKANKQNNRSIICVASLIALKSGSQRLTTASKLSRLQWSEVEELATGEGVKPETNAVASWRLISGWEAQLATRSSSHQQQRRGRPCSCSRSAGEKIQSGRSAHRQRSPDWTAHGKPKTEQTERGERRQRPKTQRKERKERKRDQGVGKQREEKKGGGREEGAGCVKMDRNA